ncbi:MAG: XisI protein [Symploca sp. SIO2G7]|nr:XisI protein [Symploca sp. SIO2G7]
MLHGYPQRHADYRATIPDGYNSQVLFDNERGQYLVRDMGWSDDKYLHATPIHLSLIGEKIWIETRTYSIGFHLSFTIESNLWSDCLRYQQS